MSSQMEIGRNFPVSTTSLENAELLRPKIYHKKFYGSLSFSLGFLWPSSNFRALGRLPEAQLGAEPRSSHIFQVSLVEVETLNF